MPTQEIRYVDPDATGAGTGLDWTNAYTSLNAWTLAERKNLITANKYHTCYCRSSAGTPDTSTCDLSINWVTDATHYIEIIGADFPADGVWDDSAFVIHNNDSHTQSIKVGLNCGDVRFYNLQFKVTCTSTNTRYGIYVNGVGTSVIYIGKCIVKGVCSGTGAAYGIKAYDSSMIVHIYDTVVYDFVSGSDNGFVGIQVYSAGAPGSFIYNCVVYNCYTGISRAGGTVSVINCAVGNCTDDIGGSPTVSFCCTDDGDGTDAQNPSGGDWTNEFNNIAGEDFSIKTGGNCEDNGTDDPGSGLYSDDITDTAFSSPWDIGAFAYSPGGGGAVLVGTCVHIVYTSETTGYIWYTTTDDLPLADATDLVHSDSGAGVTLNGTSAHDSTYFHGGELHITGGNNSGFRRQIYNDDGEEFTFLNPLPYSVEAGDTYDVYPGCDGSSLKCGTIFNNESNFEGYLYIPKIEETAL